MGGLVSADQPRAAAQEETGLQIPRQIRDTSAAGGNKTGGASSTIQPRGGGGCWGTGGSVGKPQAGMRVHHDNTTRELQAVDAEGNASGSMEVEEETGPPTLGGTGEEQKAHVVDLPPSIVVHLATLGQSEFDLADIFARQGRPAPQFVF